jgi:maltose alpha-D-glucosyltransferase/alpha-amylase
LWLSETYVQNEGDAWGVTIDGVQRFFERVLSSHRDAQPVFGGKGVLDAADAPVPALASELLTDHLPLMRLLGQRTAELHLALAHAQGLPKFAPQPYSALTKRSFYQSLRNLSARAFDKLGKTALSGDVSELARRVNARRYEVRSRFDRILATHLGGKIIRVHGDYHLGQVLYTGRDLYVIDFEGEPARARAERERLRSPLADVAGMVRSFHYAAFGALTGELSGSQVRAEDRASLEPWAAFHYHWASAAFLSSYLTLMKDSELIPTERSELTFLLDTHLLEKALYELGYELDSRPRWVELPLRGLLEVLDG